MKVVFGAFLFWEVFKFDLLDGGRIILTQRSALDLKSYDDEGNLCECHGQLLGFILHNTLQPEASPKHPVLSPNLNGLVSVSLSSLMPFIGS